MGFYHVTTLSYSRLSISYYRFFTISAKSSIL